jgi:hypothetical protein
MARCTSCGRLQPKLRLPQIGDALGSAQLLALYEALRLVCDILEGQLCQPRFCLPGRVDLNAAGEYLEALREAAMVAADDLAGVARRAARESSDGLDNIDRLILSDEIRGFECTSLIT